MKELSPEAKALYEMLTAETTEGYESMFMEHKKKILDAVRVSVTDAKKQYKDVHTNLNSRNRGTSTTRSAATSVCTATSARASIGGIPEPAAATVSATPGRDLHSVSPSKCSTVCLGGDTSSTATPASPTTVSIILPSPVEIEDVHDAVGLDVADLAASAPTTCSVECPSVYAAAITLSATPNSSTTTCGVVSEPATLVDSDKALDVDVTGDTPPTSTICLLGGPDNSTGGEDTVPLSLNLRSVPPSSICSTDCSCSSVMMFSTFLRHDLMSAFNKELKVAAEPSETPPSMLTEACLVINDVPTVTAFVPWPPPRWNRARTPLIYGLDLCHDAQQKRGKEILFEDSKGKLNTNWIEPRKYRHLFERMEVVKLKPPWPSSLGMCMNMQIGKILPSLGSDSTNDQSSTCKKWCLGDVFWKLANCLPDPPCVQPANVVSWSCNSISYVELQPWFFYSAYLVNCISATAQFLLSCSTQMNVASYCEASLNLVVYCGYLSLNIAHTHTWLLMIVGHLLQDGLVLHVMQLMIRAGKYRWPPPTSNMSTVCINSNMHSTLDIKRTPGDCIVLHIVELQVWPALQVSNFVPEVQSSQLQPIVFKWSVPSCYDMPLQYEHLKQGRPPDQTTEFLGVQLQLESRNMGGITSIKKNLPPRLRKVYNTLGRLTSNHCPAEPFAIEYWLIPWEPGDDNPGHNLREKIISLAITCELLYSVSVDDKLPADHYWLWCMKCVELSRVRVEAYFSLPSVDQGRLKCTNLQNPSCWNGWHSSSLLIHWLHVPCLQLFWGLLCAVQGYVWSSTSVVFANLNGVSAVQHQYTCARVLMVADYKEWIHHHILLGLLDLALTDWKTWISGLYFWTIYFGASTCGRDVSTLWWLQFAITNSLGSQDEYTSSFTIGTSLDLMEMGIYYRSTHYTEVHILNAISLWLNTSTSLHGGKFYWLLGLHSSWDQFRTESENCFDSQYFEWQIPWYSILYASSSCGLALFHERFDQDWVLSSPVGYIIQYGSEHILQFLEYNGLTWKYFSYKEIRSEHATHYVSVASPNFGGNGGLIMGFSVKTMEPQQTKVLCCSLLIQWPGVPISAKASFSTTLQNATQNWGVDICGQNWQDSTKLQNHSCWNEWSFLLHIPVHFTEPILLLGILLLAHPVELNGFGKLKKYWDPRGVELRLSEAAFVLWLIMLWDPGGFTWCRLEVKPSFKEGGLSATSLVGRLVGRYYWAMAYSGARRGMLQRDIYTRTAPTGEGACNGKETAASAEGLAGRALGVSRVSCSSSSPRSPASFSNVPLIPEDVN